MLNHRELIADINVSRDYLPDDYRYRNWNLGLLRGSVRCNDNNVFIYGNSGIWKTDSTGLHVSDFNKGLPIGADFRNIKAMVQTPDGSLFCCRTVWPLQERWKRMGEYPSCTFGS